MQGAGGEQRSARRELHRQATATQSGTSMAAPHAAGAGALMLQAAPAATPSAIALGITANATAGRIAAVGAGSPNLLLSSDFVGGAVGVP